MRFGTTSQTVHYDQISKPKYQIGKDTAAQFVIKLQHSTNMSDDESDGNDVENIFAVLLVAVTVAIANQNGVLIDNRRFHPLLYRRVLNGTIRRGSLQPARESTFWQVYNSGQDESLIQLTGFHKPAFDALLRLFEPIYNEFTPHCQTGHIRRLHRAANRSRLLTAASCLGLVLTWLRSRGGSRSLCFMYGIIPATCSTWLRFGKRVLLRVLLHCEAACVKMPTADEAARYVDTIAEKYPALTNVWGAMDGLKIPIETAGDTLIQNQFYNGWKCSHYISNLFLFSPAGKICAAYFNAPGTTHDSTMARLGGIYDKIDKMYAETGYKVVVDSAFGKGERASLVKSFANNVNNQGVANQRISVNRDATSVRQLSEWGMRGLQGSFPRLKDRIKWEERGERKFLLQLVIFLFNYRSEAVGFNQITTVYLPNLQHPANYMV